MEKAYSSGPMAANTTDNGPKTNKMEKEYTLAKAKQKQAFGKWVNSTGGLKIEKIIFNLG